MKALRPGVLGWGFLLASMAASSLEVRGAEQPVLVFPQVVGGSGFTTEILFTNTSNYTAVGTVFFHQPGGDPQLFSIEGALRSEVGFRISPGGAMKIEIDAVGEVKSGWARVAAEAGGWGLGGALIYRYEGSEVSVPASTVASQFHVFVERNASARTAVAVVNPGESAVVLIGEVRDGAGGLVGRDEAIEVAGNRQLARFVDELFEDLPDEFRGSIHLRSMGPGFAAVGLRQKSDGVLAGLGGSIGAYIGPIVYATDGIVGGLMYVPAGTFVQGSPANEPCREPWDLGSERRFTHTLTRNLAVMETEVTRRMWADLKTAQPSLPADPTDTDYGSGTSNPVQMVTWHEAVLFANLLSVQRGLTRVYYADAALTQPLTAANYVTDDVYVNWNAGGYRLPTEGEWEYFARAGTSGPFSVTEPNHNSTTCGVPSCTAGTLPQLESAAWFCANRYDPAGNNKSKPVGLKAANPWGLKDVHGNVWEWTWDWYGSYPDGGRTDYRGPESVSGPGPAGRVSRGGGWFHDARYARSAYRTGGTASGRDSALGFRLVRSVN